MPYFIDRNLEKDDQTQNGFQVSGASPTVDSSGNPNSQAPNKGLNTGSGFQNLDKYLQTNDTARASDRLVGNVQGEVNNAKETMDTAANQYETQLKDLNQTASADQIKSAVANPVSADANQYQSWLNQSYKAPEAIGSQYWGSQQKAATQANLLGNESGRFTLLDSYFGRPNYSVGEKKLDNVLAQKGGAGQAARGLQEQSAQIANQGNLRMQDLQTQEKQKQAQIASSRDLAQNTANEAIGSFKTGIGQKVADVNSKNNLDVIRQDIKDGVVSPETLSFLGLSQGQSIYDLDLSKYLKEGTESNALGVASPEEVAKYRALSGLVGQGDDLFGGEALKGDRSSFDSASLKKDVAFRAKQVNQERKKDPKISRLVTDFMSSINYNKAHGTNPQMGPNSPLQNLPGYPSPDELLSALNQQIDLIRKRAGGPSSAEQPFKDMVYKLQNEVQRFDSKFNKKLSVSGGREGPSLSRSVRG